MQKSILALIAIFCAVSFNNEVFSQSSDPSDTLKIIIRLLPSKPSLSKNRDSIYVGQAVTLTASNCNGTITWSNGITGNNLTVSPINLNFMLHFVHLLLGVLAQKILLRSMSKMSLPQLPRLKLSVMENLQP